MNIINSNNMPQANGHYSQCIEYKGILFLSGQLPVNPITKEIPSGIEEQTNLVLRKVELILKEAGVSKNEIIQMKLYISDIELWDKVNECYSRFFGSHKPVRTVIPTGDLHYGCLIEVEALAQSEK